MEEVILKNIMDALGSSAKRFEIKLAEVLVDDEYVYAVTFSFMPKPFNAAAFEECRLAHADEHIFEFQIKKDDLETAYMIFEDDQVSISSANIYASLYWYQVTEDI